MKTNLNQFVNSLTYIDVLYLENHIGNSKERQDTIKAIKTHYLNFKPNQEFKYQEFGINRKSMSRVKFYAEKLFTENSWETKLAQIKSFASQLINKTSIDIDPKLAENILKFLEKDIRYCKEMGGYCMHTCITVKFVLNFMLVELRHASDYKKFKRALEIEEFYKPYFKKYDEYITYYNRLRLKYKDKKWEMISEDIDEIRIFFDVPGQCIINKLNLLSYLSIYNLFNKNYSEQEDIIDRMIEEIVRNPYRNPRIITMVYRSFFDSHMHLNQVKRAKQCYIDLHKSKTPAVISKYNMVYHISSKVNVYDLNRAKAYIPDHNSDALKITEPFLLPYIGRYYYLIGEIKIADKYIQAALKRIKNIDSSVFFIETYSTFFGVLFRKKKYDNIINIYEGINFKLKHISSQQLGNYNFEIRFFYLLANFMLDNISLAGLNTKINNLINIKGDINDVYDKIKIVNNIDLLEKFKIPIQNTLEENYIKLKEEAAPITEITESIV